MRIAALDLGSNSFHLLVAEAGANQSFVPIAAEKEMLSLGAAVAEHDGVIPPERIEQALDTVRRFCRIARAEGAHEVHAVATSAFRTADNAESLIERIEAECGVVVDVISGRREAELIFAAVRSAVLLEPAPALCADLGGGSLELIVGGPSGAQWLTSVPLGVGRLTAHYVQDDPISKRDRRRMHDAVLNVLTPALNEAAEFAPKLLVGSSGTFEAIAAMCAAVRLGDVPTAMNQFTFTRDECAELTQRVLAMDAASRLSVPGLDARRVPVIAAGLVVCGALFAGSGLHSMTISEWALREGVLLDAMAHHDPADWSDDPRAIRRASVDALARRCAAPETHSRQVATIAVRLFDETQSVHECDMHDRELLEYAALLHDIGEHVAHDGHARHGAYLIMNGTLRGFDHTDISILAAVVRWHRRSEPKANDDMYGVLAPEVLRRVRALTAILQLADGLDRSRSDALRGVTLVAGETSAQLMITLAPGADGELELWGARRKRTLFESLIGRPLQVGVAPSA